MATSTWGQEICKALGLHGDHTQRVVIDIQPDNVALFYVQHVLTEEQELAIVKLIEARRPRPTRVNKVDVVNEVKVDPPPENTPAPP